MAFYYYNLPPRFVCLALAGQLAFLLAACFTPNFVRIRPSKSARVCRFVPPVLRVYAFAFNRLVFLALPVLCTLFMACAVVLVAVLSRRMYWPPRALYHQVPHELVQRSLFGSIVGKMRSKAEARLDWSQVQLSLVQYHFFAANWAKFVLNALVTGALFVALLVKVNCARG